MSFRPDRKLLPATPPRRDRPTVAVLAALLAGLLLPSIQDAREATAAVADGMEVFFSTFHNDVAKPWRIVGGKWEVRNECLRQIDAKTDDPNKAILVLGEAEDLSTGVIVTAKLSVDPWNSGEWARGYQLLLGPTERARTESNLQPRTAPVHARLCYLGSRLCLSLPAR